jgi:hypothetical protein
MKDVGLTNRCVSLFGLAVLLTLLLHSIAGAVFDEVAVPEGSDPGILNGLSIPARSASLADIDNDGDLDVYFQAEGSGQRLYRNDLIESGSLSFTSVDAPAGVSDSWSAAWGDYNGDGLVDVFIGQTNSGLSGDVLSNDGGGVFTNTSAAVGLNDPGFHQNVAWSDIDNDRDLDLLIAMEGPVEKHEIYLQDETGLFSKVGAAVGFQAPAGVKAYGMAIGDTDGDGDLDIYISTCRGDNNIRNNFFENRLVETGTLSFVDVADTNGTQFMTNSYGAEFHDFDNDGDLDLFMVGADRQPSKIFRNDGANQFTDVDTITGYALLSDTGRDFNGGRAVDYDNDGDLDLFFHDHLRQTGFSDQARKLYRNDGNWQFTDVTTAEGIATVNQGGYDSAWGDLDRDGDQDLVAPTGGSFYERVFMNDAATNGNHWLYIELSGTPDNTSAIGASIYATIDTSSPQPLTLRREANTNAGTFNQSDLPVHFGLGAATSIDQLRIHWPDGTVQYLFDVAVDGYLAIEYDSFLPGDLNGDGVIDASDYVVWRKGLGDLYTEADYQLWRRNLGRTEGGAGGGSVPEPVCAPLLGLVALSLRRRKRRRQSE